MPEGIKSAQRTCVFQDLGILEYRKTLDLQESTRSAKVEDPLLPDRVFFVQHPPVFTLGKRGGLENLVVSKAFLDEKGVQTVQTDRGGNITYHGPGQAVLYPIVDLERARIGVADFVFGLEELMLRTVGDFGIDAKRDAKNHGLWVQNRKIGSVGLSIKHGISIHGLALNFTLDLTPFTWANPCGMSDVSMTSVATELREQGSPIEDLSMDQVIQKFQTNFCEIFNFNLEASRDESGL